MIDQSICKALSKERSRIELNRTVDGGEMTAEKKRLRKQVIAILSEVLDHRQALVKQRVVNKLCMNQRAQDNNIAGSVTLKKGLAPAIRPMSIDQ